MEIKIRLREKKKVDAEFDGFIVHTDQSKENGGDQSAPGLLIYFLPQSARVLRFLFKTFARSEAFRSMGWVL